MLKLKDITKIYETGDLKQTALNKISVEFRTSEFVSILGPSGCGKTTTLNIIGGLDRYTSGDLIIDGKSTKEFNDSDWDSYRNNSIGFVFQSYNLINHISVLENVELGMTLSGISKEKRRKKAMDVLAKVGLEEHYHKKPNQLSGGQKQRVAIARALANDPEIILADEPTGALDSKTSVEIMKLIQEIAQDKLVIMVSHNRELAEEYSTRIVELKDGEIISDTDPQDTKKMENHYVPKKTSMSLFTALKLSFNNLKTKLARTLITAFAGSIGIIGVALVLSISNGMTAEIDMLESDQLAGMPLTITETVTSLGVSPPNADINENTNFDDNLVIPYDPNEESSKHKNYITDEYISYIENLDSSLYTLVQYKYGVAMNVLINQNEVVEKLPTGFSMSGQSQGFNFSELPDDTDVILENYEVIEGRLPENETETLLVLDANNRLNQQMLTMLGVDISEDVNVTEMLGLELVVANNNDIYYYDENLDIYRETSNYEEAYDNGISTTIVGVLRPKSGDEITSVLSEGVWYTKELTDIVLEQSTTSEIATYQETQEVNVFTNLPFTEFDTKEDALKRLGAITVPVSISIFPTDFDSKESIKQYLDEYNVDLIEDEIIIYTDLAESITTMMSSLIGTIQTVLVAFAGISLFVSSIMIGIITYVSVLERTKEIGVLRSLGARKKDIKRVFNAETIIVGLTAGIIGVLLTSILVFPINSIMSRIVDVDEIAQMDTLQALSLIIISVILTLISGLIPSSIAAKKDPVEALRTE